MTNLTDRPSSPLGWPNLLFLYTDQQRFDSLATAIAGKSVMPNLHRLAAESVVFEQTYCTQPVCTPSRASLISGQWPHQNGVLNNNIPLRPDTPSVPELLGDGWATGHFGKWHLGDEIYPQHGFKEWASIDDTYWPFYSEGRDPIRDRSSYHHWLVARGVTPWEARPELTLVSCGKWHRASRDQRAPYDANRFSREQITALPEELSKPAYLANEAIDFLKSHQRDQFCLYVNFFEPHNPLGSPRNNQHDPALVTLPDAVAHRPDERVPLGAAQVHQECFENGFDGTPVRTEAELRAAIAKYWGMCSLVDTHVGRILATLRELNLDDNTLVIFTTDHGEMMGAHGMWGKGVMYEASVRVPMMLRLPCQRRGQRVPGPVSQIDVVPTVLDYLGVPVPTNLPGQSLRDRIERGAPARDVFIEWNPLPSQGGEATRTLVTPEGWKLTLSTAGRHELRNLATDPHETGNVWSPDSGRARELTNRIRRWQERVGDGLSISL